MEEYAALDQTISFDAMPTLTAWAVFCVERTPQFYSAPDTFATVNISQNLWKTWPTLALDENAAPVTFDSCKSTEVRILAYARPRPN